jgi:hypothetical protein
MLSSYTMDMNVGVVPSTPAFSSQSAYWHLRSPRISLLAAISLRPNYVFGARVPRLVRDSAGERPLIGSAEEVPAGSSSPVQLFRPEMRLYK